ncbi:polysaccharide deacetylase family protein [Priestia koreensis]|uniref:polysaccharide deacetylase family protein n=1 Tax=Priestia koreensis TaxID=284581 RepID=UPI002049EB61|nr:polysaccharide deacetylase family protein [Priestia koreensis]UNL82862.1 polysaccharide deacetylase family protein [Priestia koreensis]
MILYIVVALILCFLIYSVGATWIYRTYSTKVMKKGRGHKQIALTFDDGPHPLYTPQLLDLLDQYEMKATFFVVGAHAQKHPDLIRIMQARGHSIGVHHHTHVSNWLLSPIGLKKQLTASQDALQKITGSRPVLYRPPWGHFNLFTPFVAKKWTIVMWTGIFGDWNLKTTSNVLVSRLQQSLEDGAIFCLHDNGETLGADEKAPEMMLEALAVYLPYLVEQGYKSVTIDTMLT